MRPDGGITIKRCGTKTRQPKKAYFVNGHGTDVKYGMHATNLHNLVKGLLTRLFTVKYKAEILAGRLERDIVTVREHNHKHSHNVPWGECDHGKDDCLQLQRLSDAVTGATQVGRGLPFPPRLGFYESDVMRRLKNRIIKRCPKFTPEDMETFPSYYHGRRRKVYEDAVESLKLMQVRRKDAKMAAFTKSEKLNFTAKPDPDPRMIQPRSPRYNVAIGRTLKQMEGPLCRGVGLALFNHPTITKGMNAGQTGSLIAEKWNMFKKPVAVGLDAARFDQHVSQPALKFEHSIYVSLLKYSKHKKEFAKLLSWQLENVGVAFIDGHKVEYVSHGARMSGDMNTGLGNCIIACCIIAAYLEFKGIKAQLVNNGDDCVVFMECEDLSRFSDGAIEFFSDTGFTMEIEQPVYELEKVVFCQAQPVFDGEGYRMVRDPRTSMSKDAVSLLDLDNDVSTATWLDAVGQCGLAMAGDIPILGAYYQSMISSANEITARRNKLGQHDLMDTGMSRLSEGMHHKFLQPTWQSRVSFYTAFGVLPDVQEEFERYYLNKRITFRVESYVDGVSLHANDNTHSGQLC